MLDKKICEADCNDEMYGKCKTLLRAENTEQDRDNLQAKVDLLQTGYCDSYNKKSCKQQSDTIQAQLDKWKQLATDSLAQVGVLRGALEPFAQYGEKYKDVEFKEPDLITIRIERKVLVKSYEALSATPPAASEWEEKYKQSCVKRADEIERLLDLQSAYEVVLQALKQIAEYDPRWTGLLAHEAIKRASEAGERVRGLVEALDSCLQFIDELKDHGIYKWSGEQAARDALDKYRGGADE